jgi:hypothetical protein
MKRLVTISLILVSMGFTMRKPVQPTAGNMPQPAATNTPVNTGGYLEVSPGGDNSIVIYAAN